MLGGDDIDNAYNGSWRVSPVVATAQAAVLAKVSPVTTRSEAFDALYNKTFKASGAAAALSAVRTVDQNLWTLNGLFGRDAR